MADTIPAGIGRKLADLFRDQADVAMRDLAEQVLIKAQADAPPSPIEGDPDPSLSLRQNGRVEKVRSGVYDIVFDAPYAAKQHENFRLEHPHGGKPKYLESNVQLAARDMEGTLKGAVRAVTKRESGVIRVDTKKL